MAQVQRQTVSVREAAEILGISRAHAYDCVRTGEIPSISFGHLVVVPIRSLDELLDAGSASTSRER
jgi:excisionase family DNA binding protein